MADRSSDPDAGDKQERYAGTPTWVKGFGIVAVVLLLLLAVILFTGLGGPHGPQRHGAGAERTGLWQAGLSRPVTFL